MTSSVRTEVTPSLFHISAYGFLALPLAFAGLPLYLHVPDFYTRELGLGLGTAGIILMVLRLLDAIQDPVIGYLSDRSANFQKVIIGTGFIFLLCGMGALLNYPSRYVPVEIWFTVFVGITAMGLSMANINLLMLGSLWSSNRTIRNYASGIREAFSLIGMLLATVLPTILMLSYSKTEAFHIFFILFALLLMAGMMAFLYFYKNLPKHHEIFARSVKKGFVLLPAQFYLQNIVFISACFLTHLAASFPAVLFLYFVTDYLGLAEKAGIFLTLYFLSGVITMPLWLWLAKKHSSEQAWLLSMLIAVSSFMWGFSLMEGNYIQFCIICILSGISLGADLAFPPVIMAQRLQRQNYEEYAAQVYAVLNLIPKIALALGSGIALVLLDTVGFSPSETNSPSALWMIAVLYAVVPCLIKAASALLVFNLKWKETYENQKRNAYDGRINGT